MMKIGSVPAVHNCRSLLTLCMLTKGLPNMSAVLIKTAPCGLAIHYCIEDGRICKW